MKHFPYDFSALLDRSLTSNRMLASASIGRLRLILCGVVSLGVFAGSGYGEQNGYHGDVTDVRVIRRVEQHPYAWKIWQPFIIPGDKKKELLVAFGVQINGKNDMGDILVSLSQDDGDSWEEPVPVFDHRERQGAIQFAFANPVLYRRRAKTLSGASPCDAPWLTATVRNRSSLVPSPPIAGDPGRQSNWPCTIQGR